jgi:hypothetical protein
MPTKAGTRGSTVQRLKKQWRQLRAAPPGERFQQSYAQHKRADAGRSWLLRAARPVLAVLSFAIGVVLAFIPGPAVVFFAISAALLASLSLTVARALDRTEVWVRDAWSTIRARWRRRRHAH